MIELIEAAKKGDVTAIEALSQVSNFDPNFRDSDGYTPLMWASHFGHINAVNMLLEKGADVHIQDKNNSTLMHFAAESGSIDLMKMLELRGLNCLTPNKNGITPLLCAAGITKNANAVAWLINKGADINTKSNTGRTPLHRAVINRNVEMISILIQNGALIDETEFKRQWTPLHYAVSLNNLESVNALMKYNPTLDIEDKDGNSPIDLAVQSNYSEIIERLLSQVDSNKAPPKIHLEYTKIDENAIWRFYIDGYRQKTEEGKKHGRDLFDIDEPGYMNAMLEAHKFLNSTLNNKLNPELLIKLHKHALTKVKNTNNTNLNDFRNEEDGNGSFRLLMNIDSLQNSNLGGNTSSAGIKEFLKNIIAKGNSNDLDMVVVEDYGFIHISVEENLLIKAIEIYKNSGNDLEKAAEMLIEVIQKKCVDLFSPYSSDIGKKVSKIILEYKNSVKNATSDDSKLESIIKLVGDLERLHPFKDGNCRTIVMLLLNRELILNGFPPTMLENPNRFDFFSTNELKDQIKKGWEYAAQFQIVDLRKGRISTATISSSVVLMDMKVSNVVEKESQDENTSGTVKEKGFDLFSDEILLKVALKLNPKDIGRWSMVHKQSRRILEDEILWKKLLKRDYHISEEMIPPGYNFKRYYIQYFRWVKEIEQETAQIKALLFESMEIYNLLRSGSIEGRTEANERILNSKIVRAIEKFEKYIKQYGPKFLQPESEEPETISALFQLFPGSVKERSHMYVSDFFHSICKKLAKSYLSLYENNNNLLAGFDFVKLIVNQHSIPARYPFDSREFDSVSNVIAKELIQKHQFHNLEVQKYLEQILGGTCNKFPEIRQGLISDSESEELVNNHHFHL